MEINFETMSDYAIRGLMIACVQQMQIRTRDDADWFDHRLFDPVRHLILHGAKAGYSYALTDTAHLDTRSATSEVVLPPSFATDLGHALAEGMALVDPGPDRVTFERDRQGRLVGAEID